MMIINRYPEKRDGCIVQIAYFINYNNDNYNNNVIKSDELHINTTILVCT